MTKNILKAFLPFLCLGAVFFWAESQYEQVSQQRLLKIPRFSMAIPEVSVLGEPPQEQGTKDSTSISQSETPTVIQPVEELSPPATDATPDAIQPKVENEAASVPKPKPLATAPNPKLQEMGETGPLPRRGDKPEDLAWKYYAAHPVSVPEGAGKMSILLVGLGLNESVLESARKNLPESISFGFSPYAIGLDQQITSVRLDGHEVFLEIPLQPARGQNQDLGPSMLTVEASPSENVERLHWILSRASGYVGLINTGGQKFVESEAALAPVIEEINARGLAFIDYLPNINSLVRVLGEKNRLPTGKATLIIDEDTAPEKIYETLNNAATTARERGEIQIYVRPSALTIQSLSAWADMMKDDKSLVLVPATQLIINPL